MINSEQDGRLGKIFVNFGRPINLSTYLEKINYPKINHTNID
jgi:glycerol-3-phosphate O-acyltransferase